jgi:preprotein translocase SecE subunit
MSDELKKKEVTKDSKNKTEPGNIFVKTWRGLLAKLTELRGEFRKIVWPSRETLVKHTVTTIVISLLFGAFITALDFFFGVVFTSLVGLIG